MLEKLKLKLDEITASKAKSNMQEALNDVINEARHTISLEINKRSDSGETEAFHQVHGMFPTRNKVVNELIRIYTEEGYTVERMSSDGYVEKDSYFTILRISWGETESENSEESEDSGGIVTD